VSLTVLAGKDIYARSPCRIQRFDGLEMVKPLNPAPHRANRLPGVSRSINGSQELLEKTLSVNDDGRRSHLDETVPMEPGSISAARSFSADGRLDTWQGTCQNVRSIPTLCALALLEGIRDRCRRRSYGSPHQRMLFMLGLNEPPRRPWQTGGILRGRTGATCRMFTPHCSIMAPSCVRTTKPRQPKLNDGYRFWVEGHPRSFGAHHQLSSAKRYDESPKLLRPDFSKELREELIQGLARRA